MTDRRLLLTRLLQGAAAVFAGAAFKSAHAADAPGLSPAPSMLHVGMNVADLEKSARFYVEALGFTSSPDLKVDSHVGTIFGIAGEVAVKARQLRLGSQNLILRQFDKPKFGAYADAAPVVAKTGILNLSVRVDNIARVAKLVKDLGGKTYDASHVREGTAEKPGPDVMFVADPDGLRIELVQIG